MEQYSGIAGCAGKGGCEGDGTLAYFKSGLADGAHSLTIVNNATKDQPYAGDPSTFGWRAFDLDVIYVTTAGRFASNPPVNVSSVVTSTTLSTGGISSSVASTSLSSPAGTPSTSAQSGTVGSYSGLPSTVLLLWVLWHKMMTWIL